MLAEADMRLKSSRMDKRTVLEQAVAALILTGKRDRQGGEADVTRIREAIVVEGRYDRARLQAVEALIVETEGFGIFRDRRS